jgi:hypothetical protein
MTCFCAFINGIAPDLIATIREDHPPIRMLGVLWNLEHADVETPDYVFRVTASSLDNAEIIFCL